MQQITRLPVLPPRKPDAHKGDFGLALLIGGSRGMTGAIALAGSAALRAGAGLVRLAVADRCLETLAALNPCYMTVPLPCSADGKLTADSLPLILDQAESANAVALGPGMGRSSDLDTLCVELYEKLPRPMVIDADALNALSTADSLGKPAASRILTPHPGEFYRLTGKKPQAEQDRRDEAAAFARRCGSVVVLKGHRTVVTDGERYFANTTGNPGMATGGSGDVLTGLITALLAQRLCPLDAAVLGVFLHGMAGDDAALRLGMVSVTALDLVESLPQVFMQYEGEISS